MTVPTDETQPLLRSVTNEGHQVYTEPVVEVIPDPELSGAAATATGGLLTTGQTTIVDFDPAGDPENPIDWPAPFKWAVVGMLALMAFTVTMTCICVVPLASTIVSDLSPPDTAPSKSASVLLVTIWELGEAAGPLLIAPLSEMLGRYPVLNAANLVFILAGILAATSSTVPQFVTARMLNGLAVAVNVLNPAVVGDMFAREERGAALSLLFLAPLVGGAFGPMIGSAVAERCGWRTVVWMAVGLASVCEGLFLVGFRETYKVAILRKRVRKLMAGEAREDGKGRVYKTAFDEAEESQLGASAAALGGGGVSEWRKLRDAVMRPVIVLWGSGVLMAMSLFSSVVFTFFYIYSTTISDILIDLYQLSPVAAGSCFTVFSVGSTISVVICNRTLDRIYMRMRFLHKGIGKPEFRLPLSIIGALCLPLTVASYGWAAQLRLPLLVLLFSVCAMGTSLMLAMIPVMAYVVDAFGLFSASAMTGIIVTRCLMSTFLPLATAPLVERLGFGWGFMVLAGLSLVLAPIPMLMFRYGEVWRRKSKYSREA
ncbi:major facilitator superfamily domain-containing protein [Dichotomopilus funicola]|uniref:Major facilitator superfamily domain-containing protein n=1 Tax=Dichotomopilus funicola TaxID=1934379 RepID=A0AAN6UYJ9_9PEZI|nr:major facilitator superfamily domain-containing protein [Dichotomopilus funicola]